MMDDKRLSDKWWRLNNLYYIIDEHGQKIKFKPKDNKVQKALYFNLWYLNEILKSRQHGVTTFFCIFFLDECLFVPNVRAGIIAHNREDAEAFFKDKVKFAYDNIEIQGIKSLRPSTSDSARELMFSNNSAIRVGTSLRSATLQYLHISEYGKLCAKYPEKAKEIRTGALNTVHAGQFIIIESTAEGREGHFYELDKRARDLMISETPLTPLDYKHHFFPWWMKPEYVLEDKVPILQEHQDYFDELETEHNIILTYPQKAWYVKKYETQQDEMKREFPSTPDEAFESAVIGAYYATQMLKVRKEKRICHLPHDNYALTYTAWDLGVDDSMTIWFYQLIGNNINIIDYFEHSGEGIDFYIDVLKSKGYDYGDHFAPHDINKRDVISGRTALDQAADKGIKFTRINRIPDIMQGIQAVRRIFYRCWFDEEKTAQGVKCLDSYRKEWNEKAGCFTNRPFHNWASHGADGFRTLTDAVNLYPNGTASSGAGVVSAEEHNRLKAKHSRFGHRMLN